MWTASGKWTAVYVLLQYRRQSTVHTNTHMFYDNYICRLYAGSEYAKIRYMHRVQ
jgi:hypothetical protein